MKKCPNCSAEVVDEAESCPNCGAKRPADGWTPKSTFIPFLTKMTRAAQLDPELYEEVEHDPETIKHAALAIIVVNLLSTIGIFLPWIEMAPSWGPWEHIEQTVILLSVFGFFGVALLKWVILTLITYVAGVKLLGGTAELTELSRALAFAYAPVGLQIFLPMSQSKGSYLLIYFGTNLWMVASLIIALRQSLDLTTTKAFGTVLLGGVFYLIVGYLISLVIPDPLYVYLGFVLPTLPSILIDVPGAILALLLLFIWVFDIAVLAFIFLTPEERPVEQRE